MPQRLATAEERIANRLASYDKYNETHREDRRKHNRIYSKLDHVKARRRELYRIRSGKSSTVETQDVSNIQPMEDS